jgi:two-component system, cell cycle sensor histidine kinase and response regulator CckA
MATDMNLAPHSRRWLVVDDDPTVLSLTTQVLRKLAHGEVIACDDARAAFQIFAAAPESYELLVTDFDMPGLHGLDLASMARRLRPRLPVLVVSGHEFTAAEIAEARVDAWLPKPFLTEELVTTLRRLLGNRDEVPSAQDVSALLG